jgi:hypothetical protein
MRRILLTPEDQKVVNRWRLVVVTIYSSIALALVLFVAFSPAGGMVDRLRREQIRKISHAPWLRLHSKGVADCRPTLRDEDSGPRGGCFAASQRLGAVICPKPHLELQAFRRISEAIARYGHAG